MGLLICAFLMVTAACTSSGSGAGGTVAVVVSAPMSTEPWIGTFIERGARLAIDDLNAAGGIQTASGKRKLRLVVLDHGGSPAKAAANARRAVAEGAALLLTDGTAAASVAAVTDPAHLPVFLCFEGGDELVDPERWPTLFRMAPANAPMVRRLADYIANDKPKVAIISDDSMYGEQGRSALLRAFEIDEVDVVSDQRIQAKAADVSAQVLAARKSGADTLVVWASAADVAAALQATHVAEWDVRIFSGPTGEDPLVRQRLADHPDWMNALTFVSFRMTAEMGPEPFNAFRAHYEAVMGADKVGVSQDGRPVIQPPDWAMYPFDSINLVAAALQENGGQRGAALIDALHQVSIVGANGDGRSYMPNYHEGVAPIDMYFARFSGFVFEPVTDDPLSDELPIVNQLG
jgi:ABC-type branched-subunit amino acid transport system substrate-binding protein